MRLLLWRHGRTSWNDAGRFQGHADPSLDSTGQRQAELVGPFIRALNPELVVSSDLRRCRETAARIGLPVRADARLREIDLGAWSGLTGAEAAARFPAEDAAWRRGEDVRRGGGETYEEVGARAGAVFDDIVAEGLPVTAGGLVVFVLHGGTARSLLGRVLGVPVQNWWVFGPLGNCRWSMLRREPGGFRLVEHNTGPLATVAAAPGKVVSVGPGSAASQPPAEAILPTQEAPTASDTEPVHSQTQPANG
ncbi:histidine phosphatase family protein [Frankia sp. Mgl5]|uniref:histidine phosphatase family protein n=1 Tax=Frankia sp. Mgl5 TaxID=2933793 RepID=UPI00200F268C|nr:histidine phosphatase family protein [Frankia sp. Mgl5]MCK9932875.1 histidine phosphatase family protein [Frankia sp. Mgl5]